MGSVLSSFLNCVQLIMETWSPLGWQIVEFSFFNTLYFRDKDLSYTPVAQDRRFIQRPAQRAWWYRLHRSCLLGEWLPLRDVSSWVPPVCIMLSSSRNKIKTSCDISKFSKYVRLAVVEWNPIDRLRRVSSNWGPAIGFFNHGDVGEGLLDRMSAVERFLSAWVKI